MKQDPIAVLLSTWDWSRPCNELLSAVEDIVNVTMPREEATS